MSASSEMEKPSLTEAKRNLSEAIREFDPLESLRKHPYVVVGSAVAAGAVLGSSGKVVVGLTGLTSTLIKLIKPLSGIIAQIAAAKMAAASAASEANAPSASPEPASADH